ncbi:flagellin [Bartonella bacilliformis str. Heidi Mejia]|uniref:Flagellin n=2 Tax=Bartonella bacilliformis TaxID=774 RepID=A1UTL2_BARBK|nr:flagellin [Bartonella bacilliformis]ABM44761.1 flagellin A [Bartonella bacilliformis KC583]AMG86075.1 flagellin [Bartonella bacilliformis]EYS89603.1 flagellin [Bartonella bacilliformis San Pedro600-02]EYS92542.1 flagellin [Bartonella bacilliformis str. Heidi Mejia]EYS94742.1 flagellin [Bartonella bacilliformis Peru-18]
MGSSILTNRSAMTALQTLRNIDNNLDKSKDRISTGLRIGSASDNTAYWSISSMMKHDSNTMSAVVDAINLGREQVNVAATAVNLTKESLDDIQKSMVSAREKSDDDIMKIQDSIKGNMQNISNAIQSAAFGGKNILSNGGEKVGIAAGYRREGSAVYVDMIEVGGAELNFGVMGPDGTIDMTQGILKGVFGKSDKDIDAGIKTFTEAADKQKGLEDALAKAEAAVAANPNDEAAKTALEEAKKAVEDNKEDWTKAQSDFKVVADSMTLNDFVQMQGVGGLPSVAQSIILNSVQKTVRHAVDVTLTAGSKIGSAVNQVDSQLNFVKRLLDNIEAGIGALVDADMNAESAKLSALQVQQQLGIQALSIANQGSQNILGLFRN